MQASSARGAIIRQALIDTDHSDPTVQLIGKHRKMAENPFRFLRGSAGLFYADFKQQHIQLPDAVFTWPLTMVIGDCHLANFGLFTEDGSSGDRVKFGPNDFDDACIGHAVWDLVRLSVSLLLAADYCRGVQQGAYPSDEVVITRNEKVTSEAGAAAAVRAFLLAYQQQLANIARDPEQRFDVLDHFEKGHVLRPLLKKTIKRSVIGEHFLQKSTLAKNVDLQQRPLRFIDKPGRFERLSADETATLADAFAPYMSDQILDIVARHGAGTGSLNMQRYYVLVGPAHIQHSDDLALCHIVEIKQQRDAAPLAFFRELSPMNRLNAAHLTVDCQRQMLRRPDLVLDELIYKDQPFLVRSLHHASVDIGPEDVCVHADDADQSLLQYAQACGRALALVHSRGDRRSTRFEQHVSQSLHQHLNELQAACQRYAQQVINDYQWLKSHVAQHTSA